ncbi:PKD domain-containing protein [Shewanella sedimentimangrovi]|uniref:Ig-like domain-containing protein n=1 Tax=Shewanella sedimentimangrovi TaxID=2814293 RepID=A0ABX7R209_9GAMM|nr:PKD domain-containing protein [Shewanella sedimentimangrovi]QSX37519.1 hypothetical protein JYB85_01335 [Shewanella sedimentimangrovi]
MIILSYKKTIIASLIAASLSACGGGNDKTTPTPVNQAPTISVTDGSILEGATINLSAVASDSDGSISSYSWSQKSGTSVTLSGANTASISFTAPAVTEDETLVFTVTVTDDKGATAAKDVTVTVTAKMLELTMQGKITDGPIANAKVVVVVGDQAFAATANAQGDYSIDISVDDAYEDDLLLLIATGPEAESKTKLISLPGSLGDMMAAAGSDAVLTKDEAFGVNVTNVTTASYALLRAANQGQEIDSKASLEAALKNYDSTEVLSIATALKLAIDYSAEHTELALPEGINDTAQLVEQLESVRDYLLQTQQALPDLYQQAMNEVIADPELVARTSDVSVAGSYYFHKVGGVLGGDRLVLNQDGSGYMYRLKSSCSLTWEQTEEGVVLTYTGQGLLNYQTSEWMTVNGLGRLVFFNDMISKSLVNWLSLSDSAAQLIIKDTHYYHFPNGEFGDVQTGDTAFVANQATRGGGVVNAQSLMTTDVAYSANVPEAYADVADAEPSEDTWTRATVGLTLSSNSSAILSLSSMHLDGTVATQQLAASYSYGDDGHLKIAAQDGGKSLSLDYAMLASTTPMTTNVLMQDGGNSVSSGYIFRKDMQRWTADMVPGIYDLGWNMSYPLDYLWLELNADGSALTVFTADFSEDGQLQEGEYYLMPSRWQLNEDGTLSVRRYRHNRDLTGNTAYCLPQAWDTDWGDDCQLYNDRVWDLYQVDANRHFVRQTSKYFDDFRGSAYLPEDYQQFAHIMYQGYLENRIWTKVSERPLTLPPAVMARQGLTAAQLAPAAASLVKSAVGPWSTEELARREATSEAILERRH